MVRPTSEGTFTLPEKGSTDDKGAQTVEAGSTLYLHGMVTGDLIVKPGATAIVHGMVNGTVRNEGGQVEIYGKADRVADTGSTRTHIDPKAAIG